MATFTEEIHNKKLYFLSSDLQGLLTHANFMQKARLIPGRFIS